jgi:hypothetical protein
MSPGRRCAPTEWPTSSESALQAFLDQGIHREAEKALQLFRDAAFRDAATVALVQKLLRYLNRAQGDPRLRFEG